MMGLMIMGKAKASKEEYDHDLKTLLETIISDLEDKIAKHKADISSTRDIIIINLRKGRIYHTIYHVESMIKKTNMMEAYVQVEECCRMLVINVNLIDSQRECPEELVEAVAGVLFPSKRLRGEVKGFQEVRQIFTSRYGTEFVNNIMEGDLFVDAKLVETWSLLSQQISEGTKMDAIKRIAEEEGIDMDPDVLTVQISPKDEISQQINHDNTPSWDRATDDEHGRSDRIQVDGLKHEREEETESMIGYPIAKAVGSKTEKKTMSAKLFNKIHKLKAMPMPLIERTKPTHKKKMSYQVNNESTSSWDQATNYESDLSDSTEVNYRKQEHEEDRESIIASPSAQTAGSKTKKKNFSTQMLSKFQKFKNVEIMGINARTQGERNIDGTDHSSSPQSSNGPMKNSSELEYQRDGLQQTTPTRSISSSSLNPNADAFSGSVTSPLTPQAVESKKGKQNLTQKFWTNVKKSMNVPIHIMISRNEPTPAAAPEDVELSEVMEMKAIYKDAAAAAHEAMRLANLAAAAAKAAVLLSKHEARTTSITTTTTCPHCQHKEGQDDKQELENHQDLSNSYTPDDDMGSWKPVESRRNRRDSRWSSQFDTSSSSDEEELIEKKVQENGGSSVVEGSSVGANGRPLVNGGGIQQLSVRTRMGKYY